MIDTAVILPINIKSLFRWYRRVMNDLYSITVFQLEKNQVESRMDPDAGEDKQWIVATHRV